MTVPILVWGMPYWVTILAMGSVGIVYTTIVSIGEFKAAQHFRYRTKSAIFICLNLLRQH